MKKSRREFLKSTGAFAAIGIGAAKIGMLRETLAVAKSQGKQVFNERNLNSIIPKDPKDYPNWIKGPTGDLKAWLRERFQFTSDQEEHLNSLTPEHINKIKDALRQASAKKAKLSVALVRAQSAKASTADPVARKPMLSAAFAPASSNALTPVRVRSVDVEVGVVPPTVKVVVTKD